MAIKSKDSPFGAAVKLLSMRALSCLELKDALLRRKYSLEEAAGAVEACISRGLIDESAYASALVRRYTEKGYGKRAIYSRLKTHGLDTEEIARALEEYSVSDDRLDELLRQHLHSDFSPASQNRAVAFLLRRGFAYSDIRRALERISRNFSDSDEVMTYFESEEDYNGLPSDSDSSPDGAYDE